MVNSFVSYESSSAEDAEVKPPSAAPPASAVPVVNGESRRHVGIAAMRSADDDSKLSETKRPHEKDKLPLQGSEQSNLYLRVCLEPQVRRLHQDETGL